MKEIVKKAAALIAVTSLAAACLASCSSDDSDKKNSEKDDSAVTTTTAAEKPTLEGEIRTWGRISVLLPTGWTLKTGDFLDENNEHLFSVKKSEIVYYDFSAYEDANLIMDTYNYNKKTYTNGQKDLPDTKCGDITWKGFEYDAFGIPAFEVYTEVNGLTIKIGAAGNAFDSDTTRAVLESIRVS